MKIQDNKMIKRCANGNEYVLSGDTWVRNFINPVSPVDINVLTDSKDYNLMVENEVKNSSLDISEIDTDKTKHTKAIIVSDGYDFENKQKLLLGIPSNVVLIATNRSLAKWKINKKIDYFLVNNPYPECMIAMPKHKYNPPCVLSSRTYHQFVKEYDRRGSTIYKYSPTPEKRFSSSISKSICMIDEYRNPICAAIGLCFKFGVSKLMLFCCDSSFNSDRPSAEKINNGLWIYPQQRVAHNIINGNLYWYKKAGAEIVDHSSGLEYDNVPYISESEIVNYFK